MAFGPGGDVTASGAAIVDTESAAMYRSRNYQLEMLEASLRENVIVAVSFGRQWKCTDMHILTFRV